MTLARSVRGVAAGAGVLALFMTAATGTQAQARHAHAKPAVAIGKPQYVGGAGGVYYRNMVVVLTWHDVEPKGVYDTISTANFSAQMQALKTDGFHVVAPSALAPFLAGKRPVPDNAVLLTFDNGTEGVYQNALPVLRRYRYPILLFPIFGRTGVHSDFLTASQLKALVATGFVTLGSHTYQEHNAIAVGPSQTQPADVGFEWNGKTHESLSHYEARVTRDAALAQANIKRYQGRPEPYFSDPFGQYTPLLLREIAKEGFTLDFTTFGWAATPGSPADRIPRINVGTGASTASSMVGAILTVASDTAKDPSLYPPVSHVITWR